MLWLRRKQFFFEKKNQKTFVNLACACGNAVAKTHGRDKNFILLCECGNARAKAHDPD
jgi:hypothetical protein